MQMRVLFASLTLAALTTSASPAQARNILVIIGDDMGVDAELHGLAPSWLAVVWHWLHRMNSGTPASTSGKSRSDRGL